MAKEGAGSSRFYGLKQCEAEEVVMDAKDGQWMCREQEEGNSCLRPWHWDFAPSVRTRWLRTRMPGCIGPSSGTWPQRVLLLMEKMKEGHIAFKYGKTLKRLGGGWSAQVWHYRRCRHSLPIFMAVGNGGLVCLEWQDISVALCQSG